MKQYWIDKELHIFTNGIDFVIANGIEEAREIVLPMYGYNQPYEKLDWMAQEEVDVDGWEQFPDENNFTLCSDDGVTQETKTASEWVKINGKGYFASSEY